MKFKYRQWKLLTGLMAVVVALYLNATEVSAQVMVKKQSVLMGSRFEITIVEKDSVTALLRINQVIEEVKRIESLISEWDLSTQISEVNRHAGVKPVKVDREVFELTLRAIEYAKMSKGAFDISIAALDKIWVFDGSMTAMPSEVTIRKSIENVGYQHIRLDSLHSTIFLEKKGMKIGFGSIGKGYAADKGRELMKSLGVQAGIVNASGDLAAWGQQSNGQPWRIGINNPFKVGKIVKVIKVEEGSAATSGSYEKYAEIENQRYSHIINPKTGYPATGLTSVTISGPNTEFANALSTSIMVLGRKEGKKLVKRFSDYSYVFITDKGKVYKSKR